MNDRKEKTIKQKRKDMLKKYEGKLSGLYDHLKEGVDYLDDIQRNKRRTQETNDRETKE
jgi:ribosomal protein S17E